MDIFHHGHTRQQGLCHAVALAHYQHFQQHVELNNGNDESSTTYQLQSLGSKFIEFFLILEHSPRILKDADM